MFFVIGKCSKYKLAILFFLIPFSIFSVSAAMFGENHHVFSVVMFLSNVGYASALIVRSINPKLVEIICLIVCLFFLLCAWFGFSPGSIFVVSRNFISIFMLLVVSFYYISCWQYGINPKLYISFLALIVALWAIGRAGIAVLLGVFLFTYFFLPRKGMKVRIIVVLLVLVVLAFFSSYFEKIESFDVLLVGIDRFDRLGLESAREYINSSYLSVVLEGVKSFLFGARLNGIEEIVEVGGNPHNSFINLHVNAGIFGGSLLIAAIAYSFKKIIFTSNLILFIVLFACLLRSFFDISAFYGPLDVVIMFPVLYYLLRIRLTYGNSQYC